jgi:hypothetical protein
MKTTVPVRLYPTPDQAATLRAHCQEYIATVNVLVAALDSDVLPDGGTGVSTKDFTAGLPSAVKESGAARRPCRLEALLCVGRHSRPAPAHLSVEQPELAPGG